MNKTYYCEFQKYLPKTLHLKLPYQSLIQNQFIQPLTSNINLLQTSTSSNIPPHSYNDDYQYIGTIFPIDIFQNTSYDDLPPSIDFREFLSTPAKDQYSCGACATFVCIENMETAILSTFENYYLNKAFANDTSNLKLSASFILDNSINSAKCQGSNYFILMNDIAYMRTMETEANFPYTKGMNDNDFRIQVSKLDQNQYITPFKYNVTIDNDTLSSNTNMVIIKLHQSEPAVPFTDLQVNKIKWILSRGVAVQGSMLTSVNVKDQAKFSSYKEGIIYGACNSSNIDHAVEFVGYGKYEGKDVFVMRNSWGKEFGIDGTFYVEIGSNSFCIENEANANIPEKYTKIDFGSSKPLNLDNINKFVFKSQYKVQRGQNGLDYDDGSYNAKIWNENKIFQIIFFCLVVQCLTGKHQNKEGSKCKKMVFKNGKQKYRYNDKEQAMSEDSNKNDAFQN